MKVNQYPMQSIYYFNGLLVITVTLSAAVVKYFMAQKAFDFKLVLLNRRQKC